MYAPAPGGVKAASVPVCRRRRNVDTLDHAGSRSVCVDEALLGGVLELFLGDRVFDDDVEPELDGLLTLRLVFAPTDRGA